MYNCLFETKLYTHNKNNFWFIFSIGKQQVKYFDRHKFVLYQFLFLLWYNWTSQVCVVPIQSITVSQDLSAKENINYKLSHIVAVAF